MKKGQGLVELAITIAMIAIITIAAFTPMGEAISNLLAQAGPTASAAYNTEKGIDKLEEILDDFNMPNGGEEVDKKVQEKIDIINALLNGGDLTPDQVAALLEFLNQTNTEGSEVSGVMSEFLLDGLDPDQLAALADALGLDPNDIEGSLADAIAEELGVGSVNITLNPIDDETRAALEAAQEALGDTQAGQALADALTNGDTAGIYNAIQDYSSEIDNADELIDMLEGLLDITQTNT